MIIAPDIQWLNESLSLEQYTQLINVAYRLFLNKPADPIDRILGDEDRAFLQTLPQHQHAHGSLEHMLELLTSLARDLIKPKVLQSDLVAAGLHEPKATTFADLWRENAALVVDRVKEVCSFGVDSFRPQLVDVQWKLKVATASSEATNLSTPLGELALQLEHANTTTTNLPFVFNHSELSTFYENIELMQTRLDQLQQQQHQ